MDKRRSNSPLAVPICILTIVMLMAMDAGRNTAHSSLLLQGGGPPVLPMRVYGKVQIERMISDGGNEQVVVNVPPGTVVKAFVAGKLYATTNTFVQGQNSVYLLDIPGDPPSSETPVGGNPGAIVSFTVMERAVEQTTTWESGVQVQLNLKLRESASPSPPILIPEPVSGILVGVGLLGLSLSWLNRRRQH